jgi:hypothetical protein
MSDIRWYPEDSLMGHARYCAHPYHSLMYHCSADPAEPATMRGEPSQAWIADHKEETLRRYEVRPAAGAGYGVWDARLATWAEPEFGDATALSETDAEALLASLKQENLLSTLRQEKRP